MNGENALREAVKEFLNKNKLSNCYFVTLTMKQITHTAGRLTKERASINIKHFLNRLNRAEFGAARANRLNTRLRCITSVEKSLSGRIHVHMLIEKSQKYDQSAFEELTRKLWTKKTEFGYEDILCIDACDPIGLHHYITKEIRFDTDCIDWKNTHLHS